MKPGIELRHFRYALAVAEEGSFTGAAARLGVTQPALSRAIRALEETVGTALFERGHHGAHLTEAGRTFTDHARSVDETVRAALTRTNRVTEMPRHLRITARGCDVGTLETLVESFNAEQGTGPAARGSLAIPHKHIDEVRSGAVDATLVRFPDDLSRLDSDVIRTSPRVALLANTHPLADRPLIGRAELAGERIPVWSGHTPEQTSFWTATDLAWHDWEPGPTVSDAAQYGACIRLGDAIGFVATDLLCEMVLTGITVVPMADVSPCELRIAWAPGATSRDLADFVRYATAVADRPPETTLR